MGKSKQQHQTPPWCRWNRRDYFLWNYEIWSLVLCIVGSYNQDQDFNKTIFDIFLHFHSVIPSLCSSYFISWSPPFLQMQCIRHRVLTVIIHQKKTHLQRQTSSLWHFFDSRWVENTAGSNGKRLTSHCELLDDELQAMHTYTVQTPQPGNQLRSLHDGKNSQNIWFSLLEQCEFVWLHY